MLRRNSKKTVGTFFCNYRGVRTHIFWRLCPDRVCRLHHCLANSGTFQDLALRFTGLSRTNLIFQDFPGPGNFTNTIPRLSRSLNLDFQDFLGPISFSRTFQVMEILQTRFQDFSRGVGALPTATNLSRRVVGSRVVGINRIQPLLFVEKHRLVVEIGKQMPRLVPRRVVLRGVLVVLNDLWDWRFVDAVQTLVPLAQLTVASARQHRQKGDILHTHTHTAV